MDIKAYIESGILEAYIFGSATEAEVDELLKLKVQHPQVKDALEELEANLEHIAQHMAITPPPNRWNKIEAELNELIKHKTADTLKVTSIPNPKDYQDESNDEAEFIQLIAPENHIRVHKLWKTTVIALVLLGLLFLGLAIYMNSKNKQNDQEIQQLKQELKKR